MEQGVVPYHQLTEADFPINDKVHPKNSYYIQTRIAPHYHFILKPYNGFVFATIDQWLIFSGLDRNGTSRKSAFKEMKQNLTYA